VKNSILQSEEQIKLTKFIDYFAINFSGLVEIPAEDLPSANFERLAKKSVSSAQRGLLMAVNDCVELSLRWTEDKIRNVDQELVALGAASLSAARASYSKRLSKIFDKKAIRTIEEYYLLKGVLDSGHLSDGATVMGATSMLVEFEERKKPI
jgi:hypothetical protein